MLVTHTSVTPAVTITLPTPVTETTAVTLTTTVTFPTPATPAQLRRACLVPALTVPAVV